MSQIVLFGLPADEARVRKVVEALLAQHLDIWWEKSAPDSDAAKEALSMAKCVVFFWSSQSLKDTAYVHLATEVFTEDRAIGALLDRVSLPKAFASLTRIDLSRFKGNKNDLFLLDLVAAAKSKAAGIDPPPARGPFARFWARVALMIPVALFVLGVVANILGVISVKDLLKQPTAEERRDWEALKPGSCEALRQIRDKYKTEGYYFDKATALIAGRKLSYKTQWVKGSQDLELYLSKDEAPQAASKAAAAKLSQVQMQNMADTACQTAAKQIEARNVTARFDISASKLSCDTFAAGTKCALSVNATCEYEAPKQVEVETCGLAN